MKKIIHKKLKQKVAQIGLISLLTLFSGLFVYSASSQAQEQLQQNETVSDTACPQSFNQISIPADGKLCQVFAADFPASMIFFVPKTPQDVVDFYLADNKQLSQQRVVKERTLLQSEDKNTTLIISKDGDGSQIDILIKQPLS